MFQQIFQCPRLLKCNAVTLIVITSTIVAQHNTQSLQCGIVPVKVFHSTNTYICSTFSNPHNPWHYPNLTLCQINFTQYSVSNRQDKHSGQWLPASPPTQGYAHPSKDLAKWHQGLPPGQSTRTWQSPSHYKFHVSVKTAQ